MRTRALVTSLVLLVLAGCRGASAPGGEEPAPVPSAARSSVALSAGSVAAYGVTPATVTVTVRDEAGQPIAGVPVSIAYGGEATASAPTAVTDAAGVAVFQLTASAPTDGAITVTLEGEAPVVVESATPLAFHGCEQGPFVNGACLPPPWLSLLPATPASFAGASISEVLAADLDGNGCDDLVVAPADSGALQVHLGLCDGSFAPRVEYPQGRALYDAVVADFDGDAVPDVAVYVDTGTSTAGIRLLKGRGDGTLAPGPSSLPYVSSHPFAAADVDGDGDQDVLARPVHGAKILFNDGHGGFTEGATVGAGISSFTVRGAAGDLDGDGDVDLALAFNDKADVYVLLGAGDGTFGAPTPVANAAKPHSLALGDVDRDGRLDVVTSHGLPAPGRAGGGSVNVLLGRGDGTFAAPVAFATGPEPVRVAAGDVDADGDADVVVLTRSDAALALLRSNGDGTLAPPIAYQAGPSPWAFALASLDPDAHTDVVVASFRAGTLRGLLASADGTLETAPHVPVRYAVTADLDADGTLDVVGPDPWGDAVGVALGAGGGAFLPPDAYPAGDSPREVAIGDLDGDGRDDVAALNGGSDDVSILLSRADGTLAPAGTYAVGDFPAGLALGDLDGDGAADLVVVSGAYDAAVMRILRGNGDGTFTVGTTAAPGYAFDVRLGDLDGGGDLDVVVAQLVPCALHVVENLGGTFGPPVAYPAGAASGAVEAAVALGDLDGDGDLDAAAVDPTRDAVQVFLGSGDLTLAQPVAYAAGEDPQALAIGDVTGYGVPDVVTADGASWTATVLTGAGDGTLSAPVSLAVGQGPGTVAITDVDGDGFGDVVLGEQASLRVLPGGPGGPAGLAPVLVGQGPRAVAAGDVDADGAADLAVVSSGVTGRAAVALGNGDGTFRRRTLVGAEYYGTDAAAADLNGDGRADVLTTHATYATPGTVGVLLSQADGTFAPQAEHAVGTDPRRLAVGDVNGDGKLDVLVNRSGGGLGLLLGDGAGGFGTVADVAGTNGAHLALADLNADGKLDLAVTRTYGTGGDRVLVFAGNGDGTFQAKGSYAVYYPTHVVAADLDGDLDLDLAVATDSDVLAILRGRGDGTFLAPAYVRALASPVDLLAVDLDQDGDPDLAMATSEPVVLVLRNAGDGGLEPFAWSTAGSGQQTTDLAAADVDGDGRPDLVLLTDSGAFPLLARAP